MRHQVATSSEMGRSRLISWVARVRCRSAAKAFATRRCRFPWIGNTRGQSLPDCSIVATPCEDTRDVRPAFPADVEALPPSGTSGCPRGRLGRPAKGGIPSIGARVRVTPWTVAPVAMTLSGVTWPVRIGRRSVPVLRPSTGEASVRRAGPRPAAFVGCVPRGEQDAVRAVEGTGHGVLVRRSRRTVATTPQVSVGRIAVRRPVAVEFGLPGHVPVRSACQGRHGHERPTVS